MKISKRITRIGAPLTALMLAGYSMVFGQQFGQAPENTELKRMSISPNHDGEKFKNAAKLKTPQQAFSIWSTLYDWFLKRSQRTPKFDLPVEPLKNLRAGDGKTNVTWMGHSTVLIEIDGMTVMTDPVFSNHASPYSWLPPKSFYDAMPITVEDIDHVDVVVISHDHYDHLDHSSMRALANKVGLFIVPLGVGSHLEYWGISRDKIVELDWWQNTKVKSLTFTATPAHHFSGRKLIDGNQTLWAGWAIRGQDDNLFFSGDSAYFPGFKQIGERLGPFNMTLLECGAYNEAWSNVHMFPEQTAQAHLDLRGDVLLPIHWGRFDLALHHWSEPVERLRNAAVENEITLAQPKIGARFAIRGQLPQTTWWRQEIVNAPARFQKTAHLNTQ